MGLHFLLCLLLVATAMSAAAAAGDGCTTGCDLALGAYYVQENQNLTYIAALFGITDYQELIFFNPTFASMDFIAVGSRVLVNFPCSCQALPAAPSWRPSTYLAASIPYYKVSPGETYSTIFAAFSNLTTAAWLEATNSNPAANDTVNVTVNCTCADLRVSNKYWLFLTYPLRDGETLASVGESYGFLTPSEMDLLSKYNPGMDGVTGRGIVYIPVNENMTTALPSSGPSVSVSPTGSVDATSAGRRESKAVIIVSTSGGLGVCIILLVLFLWYKKCFGMMPWKRGSKDAPRIESFLQKQGASHPKRYTYQEVRRMTKSFAHNLGQGGYGAVYRGNLADGLEIAVKMLKDTEGDGEDFMNEVASISRTSHVNIVSLLGFCLQGSKRALIYEYMPNGSLDEYTFASNSAEGDNTLSWDKLFDIVIGIARGLEYLHNGCNTHIVHFDIKPQNILLDKNFCPKISDFGLAKLCRQKESKISIAGARGTIGYIAPEVFSRNYGAVSIKSDVYSYGMVILEMVGARKQIDVSTNSSSKYFPQWLYDNMDQFCGLTNTCEINFSTMELVRKMTTIGLWCIQFVPDDRPSMIKVLEMLVSTTMDLRLPPKAF
ncbi:hypothetical protein BS78_03G240300 [Paspalum vaginatum]|nr:hypothetical protein BS78_03G240300 [Paspalum vaginatum]